MPAITYTKLFEPTLISTSATEYYEVPAGNTLRAGRVRITNVTGTAATVSINAIPAAGSNADSNAVVKAYSIAANDFKDFDLPIMKAGDTLEALAGTASALTIHAIDGVLFS